MAYEDSIKYMYVSSYHKSFKSCADPYSNIKRTIANFEFDVLTILLLRFLPFLHSPNTHIIRIYQKTWILKLLFFFLPNAPQDSSVTTVTRQWTGYSGVPILSRGKNSFSSPKWPEWGPSSLPFNGYQRLSPWGLSGQSVKVTTHLTSFSA